MASVSSAQGVTPPAVAILDALAGSEGSAGSLQNLQAGAHVTLGRDLPRISHRKSQYLEQFRVSYDTDDAAAVTAGGTISAQQTSRHSSDRRPLRFWSPFNDWWRSELERLGRRPTSLEISQWYDSSASIVWGPERPSLQETRVHAKCLRSLPLVRDYFRSYRAKKKARSGDDSCGGPGEYSEEDYYHAAGDITAYGTQCDSGDTDGDGDRGTGRRARRTARSMSCLRGSSSGGAAAAAGMPGAVGCAAAAAAADDELEAAAAAAAAAAMVGLSSAEVQQLHQAGMLPHSAWFGDNDEARQYMLQQVRAAMAVQQHGQSSQQPHAAALDPAAAAAAPVPPEQMMVPHRRDGTGSGSSSGMVCLQPFGSRASASDGGSGLSAAPPTCLSAAPVAWHTLVPSAPTTAEHCGDTTWGGAHDMAAAAAEAAVQAGLDDEEAEALAGLATMAAACSDTALTNVDDDAHDKSPPEQVAPQPAAAPAGDTAAVDADTAAGMLLPQHVLLSLPLDVLQQHALDLQHKLAAALTIVADMKRE